MFFLPFNIEAPNKKIHLKDPIITVGSCFSDEIGENLKQYKFNISSNPFGTLYNPYSIFRNLRLILTEGLDPQNVVQHNGAFYHWDLHSAFTATTKDVLDQRIQAESKKIKEMVLRARWLIISPGTSFIYRLKSENRIVANCHKVPQREFDKILLSKEEIIEEFSQTYRLLRSANPDLKFLFTISPVRHTRDGLTQNNQSKGILHQSVKEILDSHADTFYFPSYEIMIDVLRDYRFYKEDMIHPNHQAIEFIWEEFKQTYFEESTLRFVDEWKEILKAINHKPFQPQSSAHQLFIRSTIKNIKKYSDKVDISSELNRLEKQLIP